jgi:hypothetical protein
VARTLVLSPLSRHPPVIEEEAGSWSDFPQSRQSDDDFRCLLDRLVSFGQNFTFRPLNARRHLNAEADQTHTSQEVESRMGAVA